MTAHASQRGFTLTEAVIVASLATLVMLGLIGFYLSSQATWIDASSKALMQREGTHVIAAIRDMAYRANAYHVELTVGGSYLAFYDVGNLDVPFYEVQWHRRTGILEAGAPGDPPRTLHSYVRRFDLAAIRPDLFELSSMELSASPSQTVTFRTQFSLLNVDQAP